MQLKCFVIKIQKCSIYNRICRVLFPLEHNSSYKCCVKLLADEREEQDLCFKQPT